MLSNPVTEELLTFDTQGGQHPELHRRTQDVFRLLAPAASEPICLGRQQVVPVEGRFLSQQLPSRRHPTRAFWTKAPLLITTSLIVTAVSLPIVFDET